MTIRVCKETEKSKSLKALSVLALRESKGGNPLLNPCIYCHLIFFNSGMVDFIGL